MGSLVYFLIFAGLFAFMMRFGCGSHVLGHGHRHGTGHGGHAESDKGGIATDPVCEMTVDTAKSEPIFHGGQRYYFCSASCRERFLAAPEKFTGTSAKPKSGMEAFNAAHHH